MTHTHTQILRQVHERVPQDAPPQAHPERKTVVETSRGFRRVCCTVSLPSLAKVARKNGLAQLG